jgi:hypothetical protein
MKLISVAMICAMLLYPVSALACGAGHNYARVLAMVKDEMYKNTVKLNSDELAQAADWIARAEKGKAQHRWDWEALSHAVKMLGVKVPPLPRGCGPKR